MAIDINDLELPEQGCLYQVKPNLIKRKRAERFAPPQPIKRGWNLVLSPGRTIEVYPDEVFMVTSDVTVRRLNVPGKELATFWVLDFIHKDRLREDVWFTPVKWHVMLRKVDV